MQKSRRIWGKKRPRLILITSVIIVLSIVSFFIVRGGKKDLVLEMVSGTEYISGEYGQVIVRIADRQGSPYQNATCTADILYPDKSYFVNDYVLGESSTPGNYYAEFMTPTINGIYEEYISCTYIDRGSQQTLEIASSFHVSPALNFIVDMSALQAERYWDLVERINQTRQELLDEIETTFNQDFAELLINRTDALLLEINAAHNRSDENLNNKFSDFNTDMAQLGQSMNDIFSDN